MGLSLINSLKNITLIVCWHLRVSHSDGFLIYQDAYVSRSSQIWIGEITSHLSPVWALTEDELCHMAEDDAPPSLRYRCLAVELKAELLEQ